MTDGDLCIPTKENKKTTLMAIWGQLSEFIRCTWSQTLTETPKRSRYFLSCEWFSANIYLPLCQIALQGSRANFSTFTHAGRLAGVDFWLRGQKQRGFFSVLLVSARQHNINDIKNGIMWHSNSVLHTPSCFLKYSLEHQIWIHPLLKSVLNKSSCFIKTALSSRKPLGIFLKMNL